MRIDSEASTASRKKRVQSAFSLLELLVVVLIVALVGGITAFATAPALRNARLTALLDAIEQADRLERNAAHGSPWPGSVRVDFSSATLSYQLSQRNVSLPDGWSFSSVVTSLRGKMNSGIGEISEVNQEGQTATYAVEILHQDSSLSHWILFMGMSGQATRTDDGELVEALTRPAQQSAPGRRR